MKTQNKLIVLLCAGLMSLTACFTPSQQVALAGAEAGNAFATYELNKSGTAVIKGLTDIATNLPLIPYGKVSANELGVINAELSQVQGTQTSSSQLYSQVGSLISLVSQASATAGGNPTAEQGVLAAQAQDVANGITNAIAFYQGQQSVTPTPASK